MLRFWDNQVLLETESVLEEIMRSLEESGPHPNLPSQAGETKAAS